MKVVSNEEAEEAAYVVCVLKDDDPGYFNDNEEGACCACSRTVVFRPSAPKAPPRICIQCVVGLAQRPN